MDRIIYIIEESSLRKIIAEELSKLISPPNSDYDAKERLTRRAAAKFLDISYQTMYNWTRDGILTEHGSNGKKFYLRSELINVMKNS
jgi:hypothetical protein